MRGDSGSNAAGTRAMPGYLRPPEQIERFGIYSFFVKDPNGYLLEFQQFVADSASE
jgi:hypothetical protein